MARIQFLIFFKNMFLLKIIMTILLLNCSKTCSLPKRLCLTYYHFQQSYEECVESGIVQSSSSNNALLRNQDNRRSSRSRYSQTEETMQANENANRRKLQPKSRKSVAQQTAGSSRSPASGEVFSPGETRPILAPNERRSNNGVLMRKPPRVEVIAAHAERLLAADRRKKLQRSSKPLSNQS